MRIVSYNIHKGVGGRDRRYRLDRIIRVLRELDADLICLQEVDQNVKRSRFDHQPSLLAESLGSVAALDQLVFPRGEGGYGNLILSKWPIHESEHLSISKGRRKPRGAQVAQVETPAGRLLLINAHLGLNERERHWQVERLLAHCSLSMGGQVPTLFAGDSNDWRNSLHRGPFATHGFHHATAPPSHFRSFPAYLPMASLDKIFTRGPIRIDEVRLIKSKLTRRASDHLPLVVDFTIES